MKLTIAFLVSLFIVSLVLSWLAYVPIFMRMIRRASEHEFQRMGGQYFFFGPSTFRLYLYLILAKYRAVPDRGIWRHGRILTVMFCYTPFGIVALYLLDTSGLISGSAAQ